ncbi:MAG: ferritin-like domain-containing protein [Anaerolineae bacterium]|nr:ferritin-like domain-containing protein [Anaerolineae bacterium]
MTKLETLRDLYLDQLSDAYSAEQQITQALPKMAEAATAPDLKQAFNLHLSETHNQLKRLEQIFSALGEKPNGKTCKAMQGIVAEGQETMSERAAPAVKDAALITAAQRVEHYEIAAYGTLASFAQLLGEDDAAQLLKANLSEEEATDRKLTALAEQHINRDAMNNR